MPKKPSLPDTDALFSSKRPSKEAERQGGKETEGLDKVKVSFYLTPQTRNAIEAARFELRTKRNLLVTNSDLAEVALSQIGENVEAIAAAVEQLIRGRKT